MNFLKQFQRMEAGMKRHLQKAHAYFQAKHLCQGKTLSWVEEGREKKIITECPECEEPKVTSCLTKDGQFITTMSHDPARRNEEPRDITDDLIKVILDADKRCFPQDR